MALVAFISFIVSVSAYFCLSQKAARISRANVARVTQERIDQILRDHHLWSAEHHREVVRMAMEIWTAEHLRQDTTPSSHPSTKVDWKLEGF